MPVFLGIDVGTSSVKAALLDSDTGAQLGIASSPDQELAILAPQPGFAEQDPDVWWEHTVRAVRLLPEEHRRRVAAIGIGYQMHGLVLVDAQARPVRNAIIWCDSRAAAIGDRAAATLGEYCFEHLLNLPGNFTASKLRWVTENEPESIVRAKSAMLPGDYIALRLTGETLTTNSGLSEMALWDFPARDVSQTLLDHLDIPSALIPAYVPSFSRQGRLLAGSADSLGIPGDAEVTFRAGDQPTNALALEALLPGEVAATAGTSGVIYSVTGEPFADRHQRVNTFLHVNRSSESANFGVLCCINGCGSLIRWLRDELFAGARSYDEMNRLAATAPVGSDGVFVLPFGNGAERILGNRDSSASFAGIEFGRHGGAHLCRAAQESVAFALQFGIEELRRPDVIRASRANLFLSPLFAQTVADVTGSPVEIHDTQGVMGAAWGAAIGAGAADRPKHTTVARRYEPVHANLEALWPVYEDWKTRMREAVSF